MRAMLIQNLIRNLIHNEIVFIRRYFSFLDYFGFSFDHFFSRLIRLLHSVTLPPQGPASGMGMPALCKLAETRVHRRLNAIALAMLARISLLFLRAKNAAHRNQTESNSSIEITALLQTAL